MRAHALNIRLYKRKKDEQNETHNGTISWPPWQEESHRGISSPLTFREGPN